MFARGHTRKEKYVTAAASRLPARKCPRSRPHERPPRIAADNGSAAITRLQARGIGCLGTFVEREAADAATRPYHAPMACHARDMKRIDSSRKKAENAAALLERSRRASHGGTEFMALSVRSSAPLAAVRRAAGAGRQKRRRLQNKQNGRASASSSRSSIPFRECPEWWESRLPAQGCYVVSRPGLVQEAIHARMAGRQKAGMHGHGCLHKKNAHASQAVHAHAWEG